MRVLILGGTRFMGLSLTRQLAEAGCTVTVFNRGETAAALPQGVERIAGDRRQWEDHRGALLAWQPDVVVDMLCMTERVALQLLETFSGRTRLIVAASSMDVYQAYDVLRGKAKGLEPAPLTEQSRLREKLYPYRDETDGLPEERARLLHDYDKIIVERALTAQSETPVRIVRLPMVYGPRDYQHRLRQHVRALRDARPYIALDEGGAAWRACRGYVDNMAHALALAVRRPCAEHAIYHAADAALTEAQWIGLIAQTCGRTVDVLPVPRRYWPAGSQCIGNTAQHWDADCSRIETELGYAPLVETGVAIQRTVDWENAELDAEPGIEPADYSQEDAAVAAWQAATGGAAQSSH